MCAKQKNRKKKILKSSWTMFACVQIEKKEGETDEFVDHSLISPLIEERCERVISAI